MESRESQLWFSFMYSEPATIEHRTARSQAEVAARMGLSQKTIARLEESAFRKLRRNPEVKRLMRYVCQQNAHYSTHEVEPTILRKLRSQPGDASFLTISGFAPNL
jgi:hypothetical protein